MKSKKTMLILPVVVVALCAVALIGAGFAAANIYSGSTSNTDNYVNPAYVTLTLKEGENPSYSDTFDEQILYNTVNTGTAIQYSAVDAVNNVVTGKYVVPLGTLTITVDQTDSDGEYDNFTLAIETDGIIAEENRIIIKCGTYDPVSLDNYTAKGFEGAGTQKITISIYYVVYDDDMNNNTEDYTTDKPADAPLDGVKFTFTVDATVAVPTPTS